MLSEFRSRLRYFFAGKRRQELDDLKTLSSRAESALADAVEGPAVVFRGERAGILQSWRRSRELR